MHPRTRRNIEASGLGQHLKSARLRALACLDPLGYLDFLNLMSHSALVITDSGGVQEETLVLGVPCLTVGDNTEPPVTIEQGTNQLVGSDPRRVFEAAMAVLEGVQRIKQAKYYNLYKVSLG